jgi:hypothetical protein
MNGYGEEIPSLNKRKKVAWHKRLKAQKKREEKRKAAAR